jgi:uncharacterized membrane protein YfhO
LRKLIIDKFIVLLVAVVLLLGSLIFYRISENNFFYISKLGDIKEQYINFFNLFHRLVRSGEMPFWSWEYGPGGSFWNEFGYYMLGDVFIWPLLALPVHWFPYLFIPISIFKICLMAIGMYLFLKEFGIKRQIAFIAGISYGFAVLHFEYFYTHYFFVNSAVFFPYVLLGYEKYVSKKKAAVLVITLFLTSISNFYFLFMITLGLGFYSLFRYFTHPEIEKSLMGFIKFHFKLIGVYLSAVGLSMFILLPSVFGLFESNFFVRPEKPAFDPLLNFDELIRKVLWSGGMSFLPLITVPLLLINGKKNFIYGLMGIILFLFLRYQKINSLIGGFSAPDEFRAFFLFNAFFITLSAIVLNYIDFKKWRNILVVLYLSYFWYNWFISNPFSHYANYLKYIPGVFALIFLSYSLLKNRHAKKMAFTVAACALCAYSLLIPYSFVTDLLVRSSGKDPGNFHKGVWGTLPLMSPNDYKNYYDNEDVKEALSYIKNDSEFYRLYLNNPGVTAHNSSMSYDYHSYYTYQSLVKWDLQKFEMDYLGQLGSRSLNLLRGYPNSTIMNTLLNNKYYISFTGQGTNLYGYKPIKTEGNLVIEKNRFSLPIGFLYHHALSSEAFEKSDFPLQEEFMLRNAVVPKEISKKYSLSTDRDKSLTTIGSLNNAVFAPNIKVNKMEKGVLVESSQPILITMPLSNHILSEMNVFMDISPFTVNDGITAVASSSVGKSYYFEKNMQGNQYISNQYQYHNTINKVLFRFGADSNSKSVKLVIQPGKFLIKDLRVTSMDYEPYKEIIEQYKANSLKNAIVTNNTVSGNVDAKEKSILFLSIPFSSGWKATIDGKKVETFRVHSAYTGIYVPEGKHQIQLNYLPEGFKMGMTFSMVSLILLMLASFSRKRNKDEKDLIEGREL